MSLMGPPRGMAGVMNRLPTPGVVRFEILFLRLTDGLNLPFRTWAKLDLAMHKSPVPIPTGRLRLPLTPGMD
jgi:hypothetical protein